MVMVVMGRGRRENAEAVGRVRKSWERGVSRNY